MKNKYNNALTELYDSLEPIEEQDRLDEGAWETIKYGLSKLGRYKAGGKILGKGKVTKKAEDKIRSILNKESNKLLRGLDNQIREIAPKFPNDKKRITFLRAVIIIGQLYDSIVGATKKKDGEEGYMPIDAANAIIADMREMVKKYLDVDLAGVYTTMESKEGEENILTEEEQLILKDDILTEEEVQLLYEKNLLSRAAGAVGKGIGKAAGAVTKAKDKFFDKTFGAEKGSDKPTKRGSGQSAKMQKTSGSEEFETDRMKGLESNRLPIVLNIIGTALGGLSWLTTTDWFKSLFDETETIEDVQQVNQSITTSTEDVLGSINPGEGMTQILSRTMEGVDLTPSSSPEEFLQAVSRVGGGSVDKGIELLSAKGGIFSNPGAAKETLQAIASSPHAHGDTLGEIFKGTWAGTGKAAGDTLVTVQGGSLAGIFTKIVTQAVLKTVLKTTVKTGAGYAVAKGIGGLLGPLGLTAILAGITVKILREKGQRQSRAKTLDDLLQSMKDVKGGGVIDPPEPGPEPGPEPNVDPEFLKGNRNMQLAHLSKLFLPKGEDFWSKLGLKDGIKIPSGFLDAALAQGKPNQEKYLNAYYDHLVKNNSFTKEISKEDWIKTVLKESDHLALIRWVRNTRKGIGSFLNALKKAFEDFSIGDRAKAKPIRPGKEGEAMALAGGPTDESVEKENDLLIEVNLGKIAGAAGFDENLFMKNLPQFMAMLSAMYYSTKGEPLPYDGEAVMKRCEKYGCKAGSSKTYEKTKSDDYQFMEQSSKLTEELKRIKILMQ